MVVDAAEQHDPETKGNTILDSSERLEYIKKTGYSESVLLFSHFEGTVEILCTEALSEKINFVVLAHYSKIVRGEVHLLVLFFFQVPMLMTFKLQLCIFLFIERCVFNIYNCVSLQIVSRNKSKRLI